jgi:hypothetical protein
MDHVSPSRREVVGSSLALVLTLVGLGCFNRLRKQPFRAVPDSGYAHRVTQDFVEGKTVVVQGWILSETEARNWREALQEI